MDKALDDITVLDLGQAIAMRHGTMLLADLGARVIKVESREQGQERLSLGIKRVRTVWRSVCRCISIVSATSNRSR